MHSRKMNDLDAFFFPEIELFPVTLNMMRGVTLIYLPHCYILS